MENLRKFAPGIATIIVGLIVTIFFLLISSGPTIILLPGLAVFFVGLANILYLAYLAATKQAVRNLQAGLALTLIGLAVVLSLLWHPLFYFWLIPSMILLIAGFIIVVRSLYVSVRK